tara:strand:- start:753 stop:929 length:177 start_codon:yes stop_codon:yes gene_type:complete
MVFLTMKFQDKERMREWIEDMSDYQVFPVPVSYRQEDSLDKADERYVLVSKREAEEEA